jgi:hypothetical protein
LISISLMKVISKELFMKDKMPSISPVFCIQMTQLMLEKSLDLNNNTSFVQLPFMILLEDTKRFMMINSRSLQVWIKFNWMILIQLFQPLNFWEFSSMKKS